jgi:hypothetical protein
LKPAATSGSCRGADCSARTDIDDTLDFVAPFLDD